MKNLINIGGAVLLLAVLLSKKKEVAAPAPDISLPEPTPPIIADDVPQEPAPVAREITNSSISPTLTNYEASEIERLEFVLSGGRRVVDPAAGWSGSGSSGSGSSPLMPLPPRV